jgi:hypothetical protein
MSDEKLIIRQAVNGVVTQYQGVGDDGEETTILEVYEFEPGKEEEGTVRLLYDILEFIGMYGTKHDPRRVRVVVEEKKEDEK